MRQRHTHQATGVAIVEVAAEHDGARADEDEEERADRLGDQDRLDR